MLHSRRGHSVNRNVNETGEAGSSEGQSTDLAEAAFLAERRGDLSMADDLARRPKAYLRKER